MSLKKELIHSIFTTALEGGIGYWSVCEGYRWSIDGNGDEDDLDGFHAVIGIPVDDEVEFVPEVQVIRNEDFGYGDHYFVRIDKDVVNRGYDLAARRTEQENKHAWQCGCGRPPLVVTEEALDEWDYDACDADAIVQLGLFGTTIYG